MPAMKKTRTLYIVLIALNLIAIAVGLYLFYMHFKPEASTICNLGEALDCDVVNKSPWSKLGGIPGISEIPFVRDIPVSIMGVFSYLGILLFSVRGLKHEQKKLLPYALGFVVFANLFAIYLTLIEALVLKTFCIFCLTTHTIIILELIVFIRIYLLSKSHEKST
jgi:uncharacterized membrane protein